MKTNPNDFAYSSGQKDPNSKGFIIDGGLTKREHFAALLYQGIIASTFGLEALSSVHPMQFAPTAVDAADALIEALNRNSV